MRLQPGKLPPELIQLIIAALPTPDPRVVVGPGLGRDAAVLEMAGGYLVLKTDPITFATDEIGWYVVQVNLNDVACLGARPLAFMLTSLLPPGCDEQLPHAIAAQVSEACAAHRIAFLGGHSEVTIGLERPLLVGMMIGEAGPDQLIRPGRARVGDAILLTKGVPLEGAAIIAREKRSELIARGVAPDLIQRAAGFLRVPGIAVLREAQLAARAGASALHDPTEGGLATALWELCEAAGLGAAIAGDRIPIVPEGRALCAAYGLDPLGTIASGALLIGIGPARAPALIAAIEEAGIPCALIGRFVEHQQGITLDDRPLPRFTADEITKIF
ncbi:MAG: hydrogenase expression protein [Chloroflexi bacterium]|nr:hydrogenase expression protein [Chloroflexota bacterium]MBI3733026.1 hydrogenase expression protein [Chloroflexota bacterium]